MSNFSEAVITRVQVRGFRSLENVTVELEPVIVLVGPNSSGKSSFLDALALLQGALTTSPQEAFRRLGGIKQVLTRTGHRPDTLAIAVDIRSRVEGVFSGSYSVEFGQKGAQVTVPEERCEMTTGPSQTVYRFAVKEGQWVESVTGAQPKLAQNRLALPLLSGIEYFAPVYDALTAMYFYDMTPQAVGAPGEVDERDRLALDGSNAASVLKRLRARDETLYLSVVQAVSQIMPSLRTILPKTRARRVELLFEESFPGERPVSFDASSMSDGTLRVLGILLAVYQKDPPTLVGLEEPETAIHPGAAAALAEALQEAGLRTQILITTHSPDLITRFEVDALRAVDRVGGVSVIAPIAESQREAIRDRLFAAGEIHRIDGLHPSTMTPQEAGGDA